jgi:hypothetical protein
VEEPGIFADLTYNRTVGCFQTQGQGRFVVIKIICGVDVASQKLDARIVPGEASAVDEGHRAR